MPRPLQGGLPPGLELGHGCTIEVHAIYPSSGADVAGVQLNLVTIWVETQGDLGELSSGPFLLVPGPGA